MQSIFVRAAQIFARAAKNAVKALVKVAIAAAVVAAGGLLLASLAVGFVAVATKPTPEPEVEVEPTPEPTTTAVDQQRINEALWFQLQNQYSPPVKSWQQQILESIPPQPQRKVVEEQEAEKEPKRSLPSEAIISTPEFPEMPQNLNDKAAWPVRKLRSFCRELNAIEVQRNPENPRKIKGYASKGTNQKGIVRLIKKFYESKKPTPTAEESLQLKAAVG